jgi:hypothetical protein
VLGVEVAAVAPRADSRHPVRTEISRATRAHPDAPVTAIAAAAQRLGDFRHARRGVQPASTQPTLLRG